MKKKPQPYDPAKIEKKWQKKWANSKLYKSTESANKKKFYVLDMFPYPSGEGLHVGHPKGYIATDVISRMKRMQGMNVLHPMGFDAFGLPAENYAIKTKTHPDESVKKNVERYKKQLELLGFDYDWSREVNTTDPEYYKWTQWIFLQMYKKGLAFESYEPINWCPSCKTGLANEDLDDGRCERCGTPVEKKPMRQWVLRITDYADRLLKDLDAMHEPLFIDRSEVSTPKPGIPFEERESTISIIEHWSEDKFVALKWKQVAWTTLLTGGVENGQTPEEAARREIAEETGYTDLELVTTLGREHAKFWHGPKKVNRFGHFTILHFKLKSDARNEVSVDEQSKHDIVWVGRDKMLDYLSPEGQKYAFQLLLDRAGGKTSNLLDWPESIKELQRNWIGRSEGAEIDFQLTLTRNKPRYVILHGWEGSADTNFLPWLKKEFEKMGHEVQTPQMPNPNDPTEEEQVDYVLKNCTIDENTVIIGHSLGCVVAVKTLMKLNKPISGLVLVASAIEPGQANYKEHPFNKNFTFDYDYEQIKKLTSERIAVLSDTQETYRSDYLKYLAKQLGASFIETRAEEEHFTALREPAILECCTPKVKVFTTRPDTIFGVTYIVLAPEHMWVGELLSRLENRAEVEKYVNRAKNETEQERTDASKDKTGVELKGIKAINPATEEEVPVWIADYVLADYGTGAVMAVPAHDQRDFEFAKKFKLPIRQVIVPEFGITRANEEYRDGGCAFVFDPATQKYAVTKDEKGIYRLCSGGIDKNEYPQEGVMREVTEESGLYDFKSIEKICEVNAHYHNALKNVNRIAHATAFLVVLNSSKTKEVKLDAHEKFTLEWVSPADMQKCWENYPEKGADHWLWLMQQAVGRLIELGIDKTNDKNRYKMFAYTGSGKLTNSGKFSSRESADVMKEITEFASGKWVATYKLRDWVFSRQRYWGEPIPLIHCEKCGVVPVPEKDLPVKLPKVDSYEPTGTGESPLAAIDKWVNVKCPQCKGKGKRETNTMPQWAGSCWYYLRYEDPKNKKALVDPKKEKYWSPIDLYVGGAEHATRHLIYARFWHKFLYDIGVVSNIEPFKKLQDVGQVIAEDGRRMSKRYGNVVNPDDVVMTFGADTLRLYEMFMGPFDQAIKWSTSSMVGARRLIERIWKLVNEISGEREDVLPRIIHKTAKKVTEDIENLRFNTAISSLMICANELEKSSSISKQTFETYLKLLAPFAPHFTEELWNGLGNKKSIHLSAWPTYDPALLVEDEVTIVVQINGKARASFQASSSASKNEIESAAKALPEAQKWLQGKEIKRVVVIPGRLVNIVV